MSANYLIGDCHFGHGDISQKFRTHFSSDDDHDETIHENILTCAGKRNNLHLLGDIFFKRNQFYRLDEYASRFQQVNIMLGNHDHKRLSQYTAKFDNVYCYGIVKKWGFWLSHAPVHPQELYRGLSVHGHTHSNTVPDVRYFNASCENIGYQPVTLEQIRDVFEARKFQGLLVDKEEHKQ